MSPRHQLYIQLHVTARHAYDCTATPEDAHLSTPRVLPVANINLYISFFKLSVGCRSSCCFLYINKVGRRSTANTRVPRY